MPVELGSGRIASFEGANMASETQAREAWELFRKYLQQDQAPGLENAEPPVGGQVVTAITEPHPYFLVSGESVLNGRLAGAEKLAGYQSIVFQGESAVEAPIAEPKGESMSYAG